MTTHARPARPGRARSPTSAELAALRRAARAARRLAEATGTPFLVWRDGCVVDLNADAGPSARRAATRRID